MQGPRPAGAKPSSGKNQASSDPKNNLPAISRALFAEPELHTLRAVLSQTSREDDSRPVLDAMCYVLENKKNAVECITQLMKYQIDTEVGSSMCLRGDGVAVGLMSRYFVYLGSNFLRQSLTTVINKIYALGEFSLENPKTPRSMSRVSSRFFGSGDTESYDTLTVCFLESVSKSLLLLPYNIQLLMKNLVNLLLAKYTQSNRASLSVVAVAATLFLRFFVPAIIAPTQYDISKTTPNKYIARNLLVFARHIQSKASAAVSTFTTPGATPHTTNNSFAAADLNQFASTCLTLLEIELPKPTVEKVPAPATPASVAAASAAAAVLDRTRSKTEAPKTDTKKPTSGDPIFDPLLDIAVSDRKRKEEKAEKKAKEKEKEKEKEKLEKERLEKEKLEKEKQKEKEKAKKEKGSASPSAAAPSKSDKKDKKETSRSSAPSSSSSKKEQVSSSSTAAPHSDKDSTTTTTPSPSMSRDRSEADLHSVSASSENSELEKASSKRNSESGPKIASDASSSSSSTTPAVKTVKVDKETLAEMRKYAMVLVQFMCRYYAQIFAAGTPFSAEIQKLIAVHLSEDGVPPLAAPLPPSSSPRSARSGGGDTSSPHSPSSSAPVSLSSSASNVNALSSTVAAGTSPSSLERRLAAQERRPSSERGMQWMDLFPGTTPETMNTNYTRIFNSPVVSGASVSTIVRPSSSGGPTSTPPLRPIPSPAPNFPPAESPKADSPLTQSPLVPSPLGPRILSSQQLDAELVSSLAAAQQRSAWEKRSKSPHGNLTDTNRNNTITVGAGVLRSSPRDSPLAASQPLSTAQQQATAAPANLSSSAGAPVNTNANLSFFASGGSFVAPVTTPSASSASSASASSSSSTTSPWNAQGSTPSASSSSSSTKTSTQQQQQQQQGLPLTLPRASRKPADGK